MHNDEYCFIVTDCADQMVFLSKKNQSSTDEVIIHSVNESISLGEILKEQRLKFGMTVEDVCAKTKIRKAFIVAIENNNLEILPGKVYIHGFLHNYARLLGLPADIIQYDLSSVEETKKDNQPPFKFYVYSERSYSITTKTVFISILLLLCVLGISKLKENRPSSAINHSDNYSIEQNDQKQSSNIAIYSSNTSVEDQTKLPAPAAAKQETMGSPKTDLPDNQTKTIVTENMSSAATSPLPANNDSAAIPQIEENKPAYSKVDAPIKVKPKLKDLNLDDDDE